VKKALYAAIAAGLGAAAGIRPDDVLVNLVEVPRENWSFGGGVMSYPPIA
jgi:phenylpyruvate tautomerase PptA (4-oxalocrotonate tautomerase family)